MEAQKITSASLPADTPPPAWHPCCPLPATLALLESLLSEPCLISLLTLHSMTEPASSENRVN